MVGRYSRQRDREESMTGGTNKRRWVSGCMWLTLRTEGPLISRKDSVTAKRRRGRDAKEKSCFRPALALC